jgi:hypothetical protein
MAATVFAEEGATVRVVGLVTLHAIGDRIVFCSKCELDDESPGGSQ